MCFTLVLLASSLITPANGVPRIVTIPIGHAREQLRTWAHDVGGWDLCTSNVMYDAADPSTHGAIALVIEDEVRAMALLENRRPSEVSVSAINCIDSSSGSLLLKAMCHVEPNVTVAYTVHPRWHVARAFYL